MLAVGVLARPGLLLSWLLLLGRPGLVLLGCGLMVAGRLLLGLVGVGLVVGAELVG